jgi:hypothetical protein
MAGGGRSPVAASGMLPILWDEVSRTTRPFRSFRTPISLSAAGAPPMFEVVETLANPHAEPIEVWFEPWGMPHMLPPGQLFRVVAISEQKGQLDVEWEGSRVAVFGWPGSTMRVYCGDELIDDFSMKFPELPTGMSTRSFIGLMFSGPGGPVAPNSSLQRTRPPRRVSVDSYASSAAGANALLRSADGMSSRHSRPKQGHRREVPIPGMPILQELRPTIPKRGSCCVREGSRVFGFAFRVRPGSARIYQIEDAA